MFTQGLIENFWNLEHRYLNYRREDFNCNDDILVWKSQGFTQEHFTGCMYDMKNVMPTWAERFFSVFEGNNVGISFYRMDTCNILPYHRDTYSYYRKLFNISDPTTIYRAIIFLEDWKPGHYFEIENTPIVQWKAGQWVMWNYDAPHMAANLGLDPRYTVQITFTNV